MTQTELQALAIARLIRPLTTFPSSPVLRLMTLATAACEFDFVFWLRTNILSNVGILLLLLVADELVATLHFSHHSCRSSSNFNFRYFKDKHVVRTCIVRFCWCSLLYRLM